MSVLAWILPGADLEQEFSCKYFIGDMMPNDIGREVDTKTGKGRKAIQCVLSRKLLLSVTEV